MPSLPGSIAGVRYRHYRDESDFARLLAIYNAARLGDGISGIDTLRIATTTATSPTATSIDLIIARPRRQRRRLRQVTWWVEAQLRSLLAILFVHPDSRAAAWAKRCRSGWSGTRRDRRGASPRTKQLTAFVTRARPGVRPSGRLGLRAGETYAE
jgi:hypothetical protein